MKNYIEIDLLPVADCCKNCERDAYNAILMTTDKAFLLTKPNSERTLWIPKSILRRTQVKPFHARYEVPAWFFYQNKQFFTKL